MDELHELAALLRERNDIDAKIAGLLGRPALPGHLGEAIASRVFHIRLHASAVHKGSDGAFERGSLAGKTVNIKYYGRCEGLLDLPTHHELPDFFLVLTGPRTSAGSSRGEVRPFVIEHAFLFDGRAIADAVGSRGLRIGPATSVASADWRDAELFPEPRCSLLRMDDEQRRQLSLFRSA